MTKRAWFKNIYGIMEIGGPEMVDIAEKQAVKFGTELIRDKAVDVQKNGDVFQIQTKNGKYEATNVILATGTVTELAEKIGVLTNLEQNQESKRPMGKPT